MSSQEIARQGLDSQTNYRLMRARINAGLTQEQLAVRVGISKQSIHALERRGSRPQAPNAKAIADVLGTTADDLFPVEPSEQAA